MIGHRKVAKYVSKTSYVYNCPMNSVRDLGPLPNPKRTCLHLHVLLATVRPKGKFSTILLFVQYINTNNHLYDSGPSTNLEHPHHLPFNSPRSQLGATVKARRVPVKRLKSARTMRLRRLRRSYRRVPVLERVEETRLLINPLPCCT